MCFIFPPHHTQTNQPTSQHPTPPTWTQSGEYVQYMRASTRPSSFIVHLKRPKAGTDSTKAEAGSSNNPLSLSGFWPLSFSTPFDIKRASLPSYIVPLFSPSILTLQQTDWFDIHACGTFTNTYISVRLSILSFLFSLLHAPLPYLSQSDTFTSLTVSLTPVPEVILGKKI